MSKTILNNVPREASGRLKNVKTRISQALVAIFILNGFLALTIPIEAQQNAKPRKHAMPMPGMQMGHENHTPAGDLRRSLVNFWNTSDTNGAAMVFGESAVIILPNGNLVTGRQSIREFLQRKISNRVQVTLNAIGFESSSELQVEFGIVNSVKRLGTTPPQQTHEEMNQDSDQGKYVLVAKHTGADWKIQELVFVGAKQDF